MRAERYWNDTVRGHWGTRSKTLPVSHCPPKIPQELAWEQSQASAFGGLSAVKSEITSKLPVMQWEDHTDVTVTAQCSP